MVLYLSCRVNLDGIFCCLEWGWFCHVRVVCIVLIHDADSVEALVNFFSSSWSRSLDLVVRFGNGKIKEWVDIMHMKKVLCSIRVVCLYQSSS